MAATLESVPGRGAALDGAYAHADYDGAYTEPNMNGAYTQEDAYVMEMKPWPYTFTAEGVVTSTFTAEGVPG